MIPPIAVRCLAVAFLILSLVLVTGAASAAMSAPDATTSTKHTAVLTYHNDNLRTGQNTTETVLNTSNVNPLTFGLKFSLPVDGFVYAQPLYMPHIRVQGKAHNVVFVATQHDSLYAFDADTAGAPLWQASFIDPAAGITPVPSLDIYGSSDPSVADIAPEIGITSTPVIDSSKGTIYVLAATKENGSYVQRLHALSVNTGLERKGSPVTIQAAVPGTGYDAANGVISFTPKNELQRPALLLYKGNVYIAFGSHADIDPYHTWLMAYNATSLRQEAVYNGTPDGQRGSIWQSGGGLAADNTGVYALTGNGTFSLNTGGNDSSDSVLRLTLRKHVLTVSDYFTPFNQQCLSDLDLDLGSGGPLLVPAQSGKALLVSGGKEGRLYVLDRAHLGGYSVIDNPCANQSRTDVDKAVQEIMGVTSHIFSTPAYWSGTAASGPLVYVAGAGSTIKAFRVAQGKLGGMESNAYAAQSPEYYNWPGATVSVSSNRSKPGTGIVWAIDPHRVLRAYDATNIGVELYHSDVTAGDQQTSYVKFSVPTVADGKVFVGTRDSLSIYGLR